MAARAYHEHLERLGVAGGVVLGLVLLVAAVAKSLDPEGFAEQIVAEGIAPVSLAFAAAMVALALELGLGSALVLGIRRWWVLVPAAALVVFFLFLTGRAWWNAARGIGEVSACGCFGNLVDRTPAEAFWQDLLLMVPALVLAFCGRRDEGQRPPWRRLAVVAAVTVGGVAFAAAAPELPLDDLATRLKPGVAVEEICAGAGDERICLDAIAGELESGGHLVVIADLEDERLLAAMPRLNEMALAEGPTPWLLTASPPEAVATFGWTQAPIFEVREAPLVLLRPLYRRLPRSFEVADGVVTATWAGLPPGVRDEPADGEPGLAGRLQ